MASPRGAVWCEKGLTALSRAAKSHVSFCCMPRHGKITAILQRPLYSWKYSITLKGVVHFVQSLFFIYAVIGEGTWQQVFNFFCSATTGKMKHYMVPFELKRLLM